MKKIVCLLLSALVVFSAIAYAKVTVTPNGYTIDFNYGKFQLDPSTMYGVGCSATATLSPQKSGWYVRARLVTSLGTVAADSGRIYVNGVSGYNYADCSLPNTYYHDVYARGYWGGIY